MLATAGGQLGLATAPQGGAGGDVLSSAFIAIGVMILVWFLLRMQWRRQARAGSSADSARAQGQKTPLEHLESFSKAGPNRRPDREEEAAGAQLVQLGRRVLAQIEARSAQLEALIDDADARIEELRRLEHVAGSSGDEDHAGARRGGAEASNGHNREIPVAADRAAEDSVARGVYELADRGLAPVEIARELDQHLGAVELILALRPK